MPSEKTYENKIKKYLESKECYFVKYFANRMTKVGVPDILACVNGHFLGIEVKAENGRPSDLQIHNVKKIHDAGGFAVIVKPSQWSLLKDLIDYLLADSIVVSQGIQDEINNKFF